MDGDQINSSSNHSVLQQLKSRQQVNQFRQGKIEEEEKMPENKRSKEDEEMDRIDEAIMNYRRDDQIKQYNDRRFKDASGAFADTDQMGPGQQPEFVRKFDKPEIDKK